MSASPGSDTIPPDLKKWKPWVLHGMEERFCPTSYNDGEDFHCLWPTRLKLNLEEKEGYFSQEWLVFAEDWVPLPGNSKIWPRKVKVDGKSAVVVGKKNIPSVKLTPGKHRVTGIFQWDKMPEMIQVPPRSGLFTLTINGDPVGFPLIDKRGHIWLKKKKVIKEEDQLEFRIYRLLNDTIPMQVMNVLKIDISGQAREIKLGGMILEQAAPMKIISPLPARFGPEGDLMIQARPGRWEIRILTRLPGPVYKIKASNISGKREIWAFQSQNHLRMVKIEGVSSIDPKQTDIPPEWQKFPTYVISPGSEMVFKEIRRGDRDPDPDRLNLKRTWWLDFDGGAYTVQDQIKGTMSRGWYLGMNPPWVLGRVSVDDVDQLITTCGENRNPGVELRKGTLNLVAESRLNNPGRLLPAVGWDHDFQSLSGILNLPPGWRLIAARGVDVASGTWFERWTLLDFFLVLIISMAVFKLRNRVWGLLALLTLILIFHEPGAPRLVWLNLLAALAFLRFLPEGRVKKLAGFWRLGSIITLLILSIPFMVQQVRWAIYPQLEPHHQRPGVMQDRGAQVNKILKSEMPLEEMEERIKDKVTPFSSYGKRGRQGIGYYKKEAVLIQDPQALIQTGPGLPAWKWRTAVLKWNGPVAKDQKIYLWLLSPFTNLIIAFLRVGLLALLIVALIDFRQWKIPDVKNLVTSALVFLLFFPMSGLAETGISGYPSSELLEQFKGRLLKKPDCLPRCAESPHMHLAASPGHLRILFSIHAAIETGVPLPGSLKSWAPQQVLLDNHPAPGLFRDEEGILWISAPPGIHTVTLLGNTPPDNSFQISLPLRPHRVTVDSKGWEVRGVGKEGRAGVGIQLVRLKKNRGKMTTGHETAIEPFFHIKRVLSLGLNWQVTTTVSRITPKGAPAIMPVPLIEGEAVTTAGLEVKDGIALVNMGPGVTETAWVSTLKKSSLIEIKAPETVPWTETWVLNASPIWHCELSGIDVIYHQDKAGYWKPEWRPWPGEGVSITISRPKAIPGKTLTIDEVKLDLTPGRRFSKTSLALRLRSSEGGQHQITLPEEASLMGVKIDEKSQPIKQEGRVVIIPLKPGRQMINVEWHQSETLSLITRGPSVDIGKEAVNGEVAFHMPRNRWILWAGGPRLGPAVLFWAYLCVIILAALGLGRITWTPLKTRHWFLLGMGLTQVHPVMAIIITGWLPALGFRKKYPPSGQASYFNLVQVGFVAWTVVALLSLYSSVQSGLLGIPDMQIAGNGSSNFFLRWTQDRIGPVPAEPWILSVPLYVFRILMLLWAIWLSLSLLKWLRWGWQCFSEHGWWRAASSTKKEKQKAHTRNVEGRE